MQLSLVSKPKAGTKVATKRAIRKPAPDQRSLLTIGGPNYAPHLIQPKLKVSEPHDKFEREADRMADEVMRVPDSRVGGTGSSKKKGSAPLSHLSANSSSVQRMCSECDEELRRQTGTVSHVQTKRDPTKTPQIERVVESQVSELNGGGEPLPHSVRTFFEPRFGCDLSAVRVHVGQSAAQAAHALGARAFTVGNNIAFESGQYSPGSTSGKKLIAHELTHVVQQGATPSTTSNKSKSTPTLQRFSEPDCKKVCKQECSVLAEDFKRAKTFIDRAIAEMSKKDLSGQTRTALRWLFYLENDSKNTHILNILKVMREALVRNDKNTDVKCEPDCETDFVATPQQITPGVLQQCTAEIPCTIHLCPPHFDLGPSERAISLLHEAGHLAGLSGETYVSEADFRFLSQESALVNAEHFAMFIRALNGTLKSDLRISIGAFGGRPVSKGTGDWFISGMFDLTLNRPVWGIFNPTLRVSLTGYGTPGSGRDERLEDPNNKTAVLSLLAGARFGQSRGPGAGFVDVLVGGGRAFGPDESKFVFTASANLGYRWHRTEFAIGAQYIRDTTAAKGYEDVFLVGASANFNFFDLIGK